MENSRSREGDRVSKRANVREAACTSNRRSTLRKEKVIRQREELRGRSGSRASRREGRRGDAGASDGPCSHQRLVTFADPLAEVRHLDLGLVWRTGQAWICMLDLERDQLRPIVDIARGQNALRRACTRGDLRRKSTAPPSCHAARSSWDFESVDIRLLRATFVLLTLSSRP